MANCVKIKMNDKAMRFKSSMLTVGNLAMVFKLDVSRGIYICSEEEGEIIIPTETGVFKVEDFTKTYVVNGEPTQALSSGSSSPCHSLGIPLSYNKTTASLRTSLNPPPGQMSSTQTLPRPSFTTGSSKAQSASWRKSLVFVDIAPSGTVNQKFQVHLNLTEQTATVDDVEKMLEQQLGFEVILLDSKYLPVMSAETTKGSQFWRGNRKILAAKKSQLSYLKRGKGKRKKSKTDDILDRLRRIVSEPEEEEEDDISEIGLAGPSHQQSKQVQVQQPPAAAADCRTQQTVEEEAAKILKAIFKCSICLSECKLPAAACASCHAVIGCIHCLEQWIESSSSLSKCPLCRTTADYALVPLVREIANILGQSVPRASEDDGGSDTDTIPYGRADNEQYHSDDDFEVLPPMV